jgi:hypothetical protein
MILLGPVTSFEVIHSEALQATLIDARLGDERKVLLLTLQEGGQALVENLNGQIARAAGRGPMSQIDGIELDFKQFAATGNIAVRGQPQDRPRARADKIGLGQQIALERGRRAQGAAQN